jgi:repressor LexA
MARTPHGQTRERIFRFVRDRILSGSPPSIREVQEAFGFKAIESARAQLDTLVAEGRLVKEPGGQARAYRLPTGRRETVPTSFVPLLGQVQAGALTEAIAQAGEYLVVQLAFPPAELFALRVRGESMTGAGILPGDIVIVRQQAQGRSGDIVVAMVEEGATVKRLKIRRNRIELWPENPAFAPIIPPPEEVRILGKVVEIRRYLEGTLREVEP